VLPSDVTGIDEKYLLEMCSQRRAESQHVDFKRELPGRSHGDKVEFLKDLCAFANADGRDVLYGVRDEKGGSGRGSSSICMASRWRRKSAMTAR
jgi:predicted HTH transcriptional regulator